MPGHGPHPLRSGAHAPVPVVVGAPWWKQEAWWVGADRFSQHYLWEAHEIWEGWWRALRDEEPATASLVQALIQLAAAMLHDHVGRAASRDGLLARVRRRLDEAIAIAPRQLGVDLTALREQVDGFARGGPWPTLGLRRRPVRVVAAVLQRDGRLFAARRGPTMSRPGCWELPGGKVERGERDEDALERELWEELAVRVAAQAPIAEACHDYGDALVVLVAVPATLLEGEPTLSEHDAMGWFDRDEALSLTWAAADVPLLPHIRW